MLSNRVTAISGCPCGEVPIPVGPSDASVANLSKPSAWWWVGGAALGVGAAFMATPASGLKLGLGAAAGAGFGYLVGQSWGRG